MYVYQIYNLRVASEFEIPTAAESCSDEKIRPDVRLYLDPLEEGYASLLKYREAVGDSGTPEMQKQKLKDKDDVLTTIIQRKTAEGREIYIDGIGFFLVSNGDCIRCRFLTEDIYRRDQWLLNNIFTVLAAQRKEIIFHGSAILPKGHKGMILITGDSGSGKSTLSDALLSDGAGFASDDSVLFRSFGEEGVMGYGAYPLRRLMENAIEGRSREDMIFVPDGKRMKYGVSEKENFRQGPHRLEAIWILKKAPVPEVEIAELTGIDKLKKLFGCIYNSSCYKEYGVPPWMMETMLAIAGVPVYEVTRPEDKDTLRQIRDAVTAKLDETKSEASGNGEAAASGDTVRAKSGEGKPETDAEQAASRQEEELSCPEISLIVPVYNMEKWLPDFLTGLDAQKCKSLEVIFVNDGSTDGSGRILEEYQAGCKSREGWSVRILTQENQGVSAAKNTGLDAAKGRWLAFADPDDWMEADYLQEMYGVAMREDVDVVICHERAVDADAHPSQEALGAILKMRPSPESAEVDAEEQQRADAPKDDSVPGEPLRIEERKELLRHFQDDFAGMVTWCWNKLYRRELIGDRRFPDLKAMEDLVFNAEVLDGAGKAAWIGRRLYCYRQRKDSVCHRREPFYYEDYGTALRKQNGIMEALGDEEIFERDLSFCLGNLARLETEAEMSGYLDVAAKLGREYREFYEKARGRLRGRASVKAAGYRYMKRAYRMYIAGEIRKRLREKRGGQQ